MTAEQVTPSGFQGPAQHAHTRGCDGHHEPGPCPAVLRQAYNAVRAELAGLDAAYTRLDAQCQVHWLARQSAESQLAEVRRIAYQGGQDAASARRELIAYLEGIK